MSEYIGFSFSNPSLKLADQPLVEANISNELYTSNNTRYYMPNFGGDIESLNMEQLDDILLSDLSTAITNTLNNDPRVSINSGPATYADPDKHVAIATATINYVNLDIVNPITITLNLNTPSN